MQSIINVHPFAGQSEAESVCKEAILKLEAICGGGKQGALMEELVSDREGKSTPVDTLNKAGSPECHGKTLRTSSPQQTVKGYQIPLMDRSLNQSLSYPPPPPPSPGLALKATRLGSPDSGELETCFVYDSPCLLAAEKFSSSPEGCVSGENPSQAKELLPIKSVSSTKPAVPDQPTTEPASLDQAPVSKDDASSPVAVLPMQPEVASQYPPQLPVTQLQQPLVAPVAPAQPIVITQQVTIANTLFSLV